MEGRPTSEYELFRAEHLNRLQQQSDRTGEPPSLFLYHTAREKVDNLLETSAKIIEEPHSLGLLHHEPSTAPILQEQYKVMERGYEKAQQTILRQSKEIEQLRTELEESRQRERELRRAVENWLLRARQEY